MAFTRIGAVANPQTATMPLAAQKGPSANPASLNHLLERHMQTAKRATTNENRKACHDAAASEGQSSHNT
eukprot:4311967-Pyramimonas_sp.AAC.1